MSDDELMAREWLRENTVLHGSNHEAALVRSLRIRIIAKARAEGYAQGLEAAAGKCESLEDEWIIEDKHTWPENGQSRDVGAWLCASAIRELMEQPTK